MEADKTTFIMRIDKELHDKLKRKAYETGLSMAELARRAIEKSL